jgi:multidrug efflux pump subunit AcrA (membrane-fusion protein)
VVWVVDEENRVVFQKVDVARFQDDEILITGGLKEGDRVIISFIKTVTDGMKVRPIQKTDRSAS